MMTGITAEEIELLGLMLSPIYAGLGFMVHRMLNCPFGCGSRDTRKTTEKEVTDGH